MDNSNEKPKKKKFSLFCCFSINERGKKRKKKYNSITNSNISNFFSSRQKSNIKIKDFTIEDITYKSRTVGNIPIGTISKSNSILNTKEDSKKFDKSKRQKNRKISLEDNKLKRLYTLDNYKRNTNNIALNDDKNNLSLKNEEKNINIKKNNENYLTEKLFINKNISINCDESLAIMEEINQKSNILMQDADDTVNIYGNNSSINRTNKLDEIKIKQKEYINYSINIKDKKYDSINNNLKVKADSMILFKDYCNKDFYILEKPKKNSNTCLPNIDIKTDFSKLLINNKKESNDINKSNINKNAMSDNIFEKKIELNYIKKLNKNIPFSDKNLKKITNCGSCELLNYIKIENFCKEIDYNNKTGRYNLNDFDDNRIIFGFTFNKINKNISHNVNKEQNNNNTFNLNKEKVVSVISENNKINVNTNNTNANIINNPINLNNNHIISLIENKFNLNYINKEKYFVNYSNLEVNISKISKKFIKENAKPKIEESIKEKSDKKNKEKFSTNKVIKNNISEVKIKLETNNKIKEEEENIKDFEGEIEEELDSLDEESHKINDSKSIISNYIAAPLTGIQDLKSYAPSLYSKSELKDNTSNVNDLTSNKEGGFSFPPGLNETEIEIMNENGKRFKSFIETPRASGIYNKRFTHRNINFNTTNTHIKYSDRINKSLNQKIKNVFDKININSNEIQKINKKILNFEEKIKIQEETNKKYELWIEKEEEESELLIFR